MNSEKIMKWDAERRQYDIVVIGEESHLAYNRVGLSTFFEHRKIEDLYLNSQEWVSWRFVLVRAIYVLICNSTLPSRMDHSTTT